MSRTMAISEGANTVFPSKVTEYETFPSALISALILPSGDVRVQEVLAAKDAAGNNTAIKAMLIRDLKRAFISKNPFIIVYNVKIEIFGYFC